MHDIFISYAHADDRPPVGVQRGWVTTITENFLNRVNQLRTEGDTTHWMDYALLTNDRVEQTLIDSVKQSRTLLLFMSPRYQASTWCQKELIEFLETNET